MKNNDLSKVMTVQQLRDVWNHTNSHPNVLIRTNPHNLWPLVNTIVKENANSLPDVGQALQNTARIKHIVI